MCSGIVCGSGGSGGGGGAPGSGTVPDPEEAPRLAPRLLLLVLLPRFGGGIESELPDPIIAVILMLVAVERVVV